MLLCTNILLLSALTFDWIIFPSTLYVTSIPPFTFGPESSTPCSKSHIVFWLSVFQHFQDLYSFLFSFSIPCFSMVSARVVPCCLLQACSWGHVGIPRGRNLKCSAAVTICIIVDRKDSKVGSSSVCGLVNDASASIHFHMHKILLHHNVSFAFTTTCAPVIVNDMECHAYLYILEPTNALRCTHPRFYRAGVCAWKTQEMMHAGPDISLQPISSLTSPSNLLDDTSYLSSSTTISLHASPTAASISPSTPTRIPSAHFTPRSSILFRTSTELILATCMSRFPQLHLEPGPYLYISRAPFPHTFWTFCLLDKKNLTPVMRNDFLVRAMEGLHQLNSSISLWESNYPELSWGTEKLRVNSFHRHNGRLLLPKKVNIISGHSNSTSSIFGMATTALYMCISAT